MNGPIHPLASGLAGTGGAAERASADRTRAVRRTNARRQQGTAEDFFDRQIETTDAIDPIHDQNAHPDPRKSKPGKHQDQADEPTDDRLDLTG
jgi:hypothetical protein